jgi:hypothetical protein
VRMGGGLNWLKSFPVVGFDTVGAETSSFSLRLENILKRQLETLNEFEFFYRGKVDVKLSLCLIGYQAVKTYPLFS